MALNDLNQMFSIVDPSTGKPTDYLMRLLRDRGVEVSDIDAVVQAINGTEIIGGVGLDGSGVLGVDQVITLDLSDTGVSPGAYTSVDLTVDAQGRITAIASGSGGGAPAVEDDGVEIVAAATRFNFTGAGVTVTDSGGGEVQIDIPGGGGGGSGVYSLVQSKIVAVDSLSTGITLDAPPTDGNLLIANVVTATGTSPPLIAGGWTTSFSNNSLPDSIIATRLVGPGESALQNPTTTAVGGIILVYEVTAATGYYAASATANVLTVQNISFTSGALTLLPPCEGIMLAVTQRRSNEVPVISGSFSSTLSLQDNGAIVGGTGLSVAADLVIKSTYFTPSLTSTWPTASDTYTAFGFFADS